MCGQAAELGSSCLDDTQNLSETRLPARLIYPHQWRWDKAYVLAPLRETEHRASASQDGHHHEKGLDNEGLAREEEKRKPARVSSPRPRFVGTWRGRGFRVVEKHRSEARASTREGIARHGK